MRGVDEPQRAAHPLRAARGRSRGRGRSRSRRWSPCRGGSARRCARAPRAGRRDRGRTRAPRPCRGRAWRSPRSAGRAARSEARCRSGSGTTRAQAAGSARAQHGPSVGTTSRSTSRSAARSENSAATARAISASSTGSERSCTSASSRERSSSSLASTESRRSSRRARSTCSCASSRSPPSRRSSSSSSIVPWSIVSGVRSSCEAVETKARRAVSWRRSSSCIRPSARARSPTSSAPRSVGAGRLRALGGDPQRRAPQAAEPARERAGQREPEPDRHREPDGGRGEQRVADELHRGRDLGQAALGDEHAGDLAVVVERHREAQFVVVELNLGRLRRHGARNASASAPVWSPWKSVS